MRRIQVRDAQQLLDVLDRKPIPQLVLTSPLLESAEAASWERRMNDRLGDCGCDAGTVGFLAGLAVSLFAVVRGEPFALPPVAAAGVVLATAVGAAVAGKLLSQWRSRRHARRDGLTLVRMLSARETAVTSPVGGQAP